MTNNSTYRDDLDDVWHALLNARMQRQVVPIIGSDSLNVSSPKYDVCHLYERVARQFAERYASPIPSMHSRVLCPQNGVASLGHSKDCVNVGKMRRAVAKILDEQTANIFIFTLSRIFEKIDASDLYISKNPDPILPKTLKVHASTSDAFSFRIRTDANARPSIFRLAQRYDEFRINY